ATLTRASARRTCAPSRPSGRAPGTLRPPAGPADDHVPMSEARFDLVVRGGTVVTAEGRARVDVGVRDGRVAQLGGAMSAEGARELDARERFVLPGGVDPHVHLHVEKLDEDPAWVDDFESGSAAALAGGVTTFGNMSWVLPWETIADRVRLETAEVARR